MDIWFDNESLLGGQDWRFEINGAIKNCNIFMALLSKKSMDKIGYVQNEVKIALDILNTYPKTKIYIVPIRLESCEPIEKQLIDLHWIDLFPQSKYVEGINKILKIFKLDLYKYRNEPTRISEGDASLSILKYGFYDKFRNPDGVGIVHKYKVAVVRGDKIVMDETTKLMWLKGGSDVDMNHIMAKKWVQDLNKKSYAGYGDWRLPTLEEAMSLMEGKKIMHYIYGVYLDQIFEEYPFYIWTSDFEKESVSAWTVSFTDGYCASTSIYNDNYVRAVRSI